MRLQPCGLHNEEIRLRELDRKAWGQAQGFVAFAKGSSLGYKTREVTFTSRALGWGWQKDRNKKEKRD